MECLSRNFTVPLGELANAKDEDRIELDICQTKYLEDG